jgi:hypothetical protein
MLAVSSKPNYKKNWIFGYLENDQSMLLKPYQLIDAFKQLISTAMSKTIDRCFKRFIGAVYMKIRACHLNMDSWERAYLRVVDDP